jgi:site-specific recombinase XerD
MTKLEIALKRMDDWMIMKHQDHKTRRAYRDQVKRYAAWLKSHPVANQLSSEAKLEMYLTERAHQGCSASTQNIAFYAICRFYKNGLGTELKEVNALRAERPKHIRRAPTKEQMRAILPAVPNLYGYPCRLITELIYGAGLRVSEPLNVRIRDLDFENSKLTIRDGKHGVSRVVSIPCGLILQLKQQVEHARLIWLQDSRNLVPVPLPGLLAKKYPSAPFSWAWAWLFPARNPCRFEGFTGPVRWRIHEASIQRAVKEAVKSAGVMEDITPHHFRHAWATHTLRQRDVTLRDVQVAMGHKQIETTAGYITPEVDRLPDALSALRS